MKSRWMAAALLAATWALAALAYVRAPARVPIHWNVRGEVDGWGGPASVFVLPAVATALVLLMYTLPRLDPRRANWARFRGEFNLIVNVLVAFMLFMEVTTIGGFTFGWRVNGGRVPLIGVGVLFMVIGNYLPRIRSNWWMGIRTPWTLESESVWRETHRLGGRTFVVSGAVGTLAALLLRPPLSFYVAMVAMGIGGMVPVVYSYLVWKRESAGRA
jgi:uncharacterized membrane protein